MSIRRGVNGNAMLIKCFCSWAGGISATGGLIKARYGSAGLDGNQIVTMRAMLAPPSRPPTRSFQGLFPRVVSKGCFQGLFPGFPYVSRASSDLYTARVAT